jgi:RNA polymerase sigma-70 factor, ECF subfamily
MNEDSGFLAHLRAGDAQAFETVARQYSGRMHAIARRFFHHAEDGADAVQDALLAAYQSIDSFEGRSTLWTWLYRILVNACLARRQSNYRRRMLSLDDLPPSAEGEGRDAFSGLRWSEPAHTGAARAETRAQIRDSIERLPPSYRAVLVLRDIEELDTDQTARRLGTSRGAIKCRLHRARQALRILLEPVLYRETK